MYNKGYMSKKGNALEYTEEYIGGQYGKTKFFRDDRQS